MAKVYESVRNVLLRFESGSDRLAFEAEFDVSSWKQSGKPVCYWYLLTYEEDTKIYDRMFSRNKLASDPISHGTVSATFDQIRRPQEYRI